MKKNIFIRAAVAAGILILSGIALSQTAVKCEQPALITSAGQSADVTMAAMLCKKIGVTAKAAPLAKAADIEGYKTLLIVPGFSSKGLGAAGVSRDQEMGRLAKVIAAAKEKKMIIVTLHLGGKARRGGQSDDFCKAAADASGAIIVVKGGDDDQFFAGAAKAKNIPYVQVEKIAGAGVPLEKLFK